MSSTQGRELTADDYETLLQLDCAGPSVSSDDQAVEAWSDDLVQMESGDKLQKQAAVCEMGVSASYEWGYVAPVSSFFLFKP